MSSKFYMDKVTADVGKIEGSACLTRHLESEEDLWGERLKVTLQIYGTCVLKDLVLELGDGRRVTFAALGLTKIMIEGKPIHEGRGELYKIEEPDTPLVVPG